MTKAKISYREAAEAGGGKYATVRDQSGFEDVLLKKWKPSYMQVWTQQGVSLRSLVDQKTELQEIYGRLSNVSDREAIRIGRAARFLEKGTAHKRRGRTDSH